MEQRLLKAMEYELNVEQPHVFMFHIVEVIKGGEALACAASAVLLDALLARVRLDEPRPAAARTFLPSPCASHACDWVARVR